MTKVPPSRRPAPRRNLAADVVAALRADIISGEFRPGDSLAEPVLAERFNVSRAPIREALIELEREGLVQFEATGRTRVRPLTEKDLGEIVDARIALESMGARLATAVWTASDSAWIAKNMAAQAKASTVAELTALDVEMHEHIMHRSGNERLLGMWRCIRPQFEMWLAHTHRLQARMQFEPRRVTVESHRKLLRAIESGDCERAASAISAHIAAWHEWLPATFPLKAEREKPRAAKAVSLFLFAGIFMLLSVRPAAAAKDAASVVFEKKIRPILKERCITCHSTEKQKGDLDLEQFTSMESVKRNPIVWEHSLDQIRDNEMPPKDKPQPSPEEMKLLTEWMLSTLDEISRASAGDPGPVVLRRLSNMDYTYTIRDLTGVPSLDPAKEFPVDGAAGEGFTNAGAALVMSPALLTKYLDAAKDIASHAVLTPTGIRFSAGTSSRDWTDETLAKIRAFYDRYTSGGRLPLATYLAALQGKGPAEDLSTKYLALLRAALTDTKPSPLLDGLREKFRAGTLTVADIEPWQQSLWRFASVGHIGKENGPKNWQEPVTPLGALHELRLKLSKPKGGGDVTLYLTADDVGYGSAKGSVLWENARLVTKEGKGSKEVRLRDVAGALPDVMRGQAASLAEVKIPAAQITDTEFIVSAKLDNTSAADAALQIRVLTSKPDTPSGLSASRAESGLASGKWSDNNLRTVHGAPILVKDDSAARRRFEAAFDDFRALFPIALCYSKIVPVDEVVTLTLFHREDDQLTRLMLEDGQIRALDQLWDELRFVSESALKQVDVFEQLYQFATQDAKPAAFEPLREPILRGAEAFKKLQIEVEPRHVQAALDFATQAWRRPLSDAERDDLRALYQKLRKQELPHATAVRMMLARVLVAPAFLYRGEKSAPGPKAAPVNDWELATRLSYFLWSSAPDEELRQLAAKGTLHEPDVLIAQTRRMMKEARIRRLATEFGCQFLHVRDVATLDEKSERHFPTFVSVRESMQEEVTRFFIDLFQNNRSVLSLLDADHTFVNAELAEHYGMHPAADSEKPQIETSAQKSAAFLNLRKNNHWHRIDGLRAKGRGGILGFASTLAKQSGASRTSAILRGNWLSEVVLGEKLPRPPKGVPILPEEAPQGLTERQLIERHSSDAKCASCHQRIDPFGFALEGFDAIGRARSKDAAGLAIDTRTRLPSGMVIEGLDGLRSYLVNTRSDDFLRQFSRKLLGYALGRSVQLSDKPLIGSMLTQLKANEHSVGAAIELIVLSTQFREVRGRDHKVD